MKIKQINTKTQNTQRKLLLTIVVMFWFSQYIYIPYQTPYLISIGTVTTFTGLVVGAYGFSQLLLRIPVGIMADLRGKHKNFILLGACSSGLASIFRIFMPNGTGFMLGSLFSGLASAMWISFMVLYSNYFKKEELQKSMGTIIAANNLGILIAFILGTLLYDRFGMVFLCMLSVITAIPSTILAFFIKEPNINFEHLPIKKLISVYRDKRLIIFSIIALVQQGILMSTAMSFTTQVIKQLGASGFEIGMSSIIYIIVAVMSSYFSASNIAARKSPGFWIITTLICLLGYCLIIPNIHHIIYAFFAQVLVGVSTGILFSFCTSEAMKNVKVDRKSTAMGYFQAIYAVGMTLIPIFTGVIYNDYNIRTAYYFLAFISIMGLSISVYFYLIYKKTDLI